LKEHFMRGGQSILGALQLRNIMIFRPVFSIFSNVKVDFWQNRFCEQRLAFSHILIGFFVAAFLVTIKPAEAASLTQDQVLRKWYSLSLLLIRHTPTYSPPVASRALAYIGVASYEAVSSGSQTLQSLDGQLNGLSDLPKREAGQSYDEVAVMHAALSTTISTLFANTGPSGQQATRKLTDELDKAINASGVDQQILSRSSDYGRSLAAHILKWSKNDGGDVIENMGFPWTYTLTPGPGHWVPTNPLARQQQVPLLPNWGKNRPFAMPLDHACELPPPPVYSEDKNSDFYREALEVYTTAKALTPEQKAIAFFWADDAMATPTPAGHWVSIVLQIADADSFPIDKLVDVLMRMNVAMADAFIGCWKEKFRHDLLRPITYIKRVMDPDWMPFILTPPFPEYPSGHSVQSSAASKVLASVLGEPYPFSDKTRERDGAIPRKFTGFVAAAKEAGISRLYGGIHFRSAIERGYEQGQCIGAYALALKTWR
jgi:membrane-associated phospholipid phosphatase